MFKSYGLNFIQRLHLLELSGGTARTPASRCFQKDWWGRQGLEESERLLTCTKTSPFGVQIRQSPWVTAMIRETEDGGEESDVFSHPVLRGRGELEGKKCSICREVASRDRNWGSLLMP